MRLSALPLALLAIALPSAAWAQVRTLDIDLKPAKDPQIAVWLEDGSGRFVDTLMVTRLTGTFGLGNRPGRKDFGSAFLFPYGRREMVLPIWARKRGVLYDTLAMQDCYDSGLGFHELYSSHEPFFCRPMTPAEMMVDTITCPTVGFNTDKGIPVRMLRSSNQCNQVMQMVPPMTYYPPRNDLQTRDPNRDWSGVSNYSTLNNLDAVSRATPPAMQAFRLPFRVPPAIADGDYTVWVEVNQEYDTNSFHTYPMYVDPVLRDYGQSYLGQPSVVYRVPITIGPSSMTATTRDYVGYGSADGQDGNIRPPDQTITTGVPGSGAERLLLQGSAGAEFRVRVVYTSPINPPPRDAGFPADMGPADSGVHPDAAEPEDLGPLPDGAPAPDARPHPDAMADAGVVTPADTGVVGEPDGGEEPPPPPCNASVAVSDFTVSPVDFDRVEVSFLTPPTTTEGTQLEIRYVEGLKSLDTDQTFVEAVPGPSVPVSGASVRQTFLIDRLKPETTYTFAVRTSEHCRFETAIVAAQVTTKVRKFATVDWCFIATAAYGSKDAEDVRVLRRFRDRHLMTSELGRKMVATYYFFSPALADSIRESEGMKAYARHLLKPAVEAARALEE